MRRGDADDRSIEVPEGLVGDDRGDLRTPTTEARVFLDREESTGFRHRLKNRECVERHQRPHVDDLCVDAVLTRKCFRCLQSAGDHERKSYDRAVAARAKDLCGSKPIYNFSVRHFALEGVERLVLVKDNGVGVTHGGGHQTYHIDRR